MADSQTNLSEKNRKKIFGKDNKEWYSIKDKLAANSRKAMAKKMDFKNYSGGKAAWNKEEVERKKFAPGGKYHK